MSFGLIYGYTTRKIFLLMSSVVMLLLIGKVFLDIPSVDTYVLLLILAFCLLGVNGSQISKVQKLDENSRKFALQFSFGVTVAILFASSTIPVIRGDRMEGNVGAVSLLLALIANVVFLVAQYAVYWKGNTKSTTDNDAFEV